MKWGWYTLVKKQSKNDKKKVNRDDLVKTMPTMNRESPHSDVSGSYTGTAADGGAPEQDSDDI
ncbi:MAG: hypothetical protein LBI03_10845 [Clostridiales bacterium]|jgi:hypothetical protein|nr:hypothetical protein [Clostridiales bacterium]